MTAEKDCPITVSVQTAQVSSRNTEVYVNDIISGHLLQGLLRSTMVDASCIQIKPREGLRRVGRQLTNNLVLLIYCLVILV